jgi:hypothetical protein
LGVAAAIALSADSMVCFRLTALGLGEAEADGIPAPGLAVTGLAVAGLDGEGDETGLLPDTTGAGAEQPATSPATSSGTASSKHRLPATWRCPDGFRGVPLLITRPFCHAAHRLLRRTAIRGCPRRPCFKHLRPQVLQYQHQQEPARRLLRLEE